MKIKLLYLLPITFCLFVNQKALAQSCTTDAEFTGTQALERAITSTEVTGQSFQAISSGALQTVSIDMSADNQGCALTLIDLQIDILDGDGTAGTVLSSQTYSLPANITRTMETFAFSSPAAVTATQMYTIILSLTSGQDCGSGDEPELIWYYEFPTNYWDNTGGTQYFGSNIASLGNTQYFSTCLGCINATGEETYTGCQGDGYEVIVNGNTYNEATPTGTDTLVNAAASGCDSIVTINLEFITENTTDLITACGSYEWIDGNTYTESNNTATVTLQTVGGCDSIVTLNLTIQDELNTTVDEVVNSTGMLVLIAEQSGASYQWLDCDNGYAPITNANNQTFVPQDNGSYAVAISKGVCGDTSACANINDLSTSESSLASSIKVYPNPTSDVINIQTNGIDGAIEVVDALGRFITSTTITSNNTTINLSNNNKGVYLLRVVQNNEAQTIRVVLN